MPVLAHLGDLPPPRKFMVRLWIVRPEIWPRLTMPPPLRQRWRRPSTSIGGATIVLSFAERLRLAQEPVDGGPGSAGGADRVGIVGLAVDHLDADLGADLRRHDPATADPMARP